jgi:chromosome segregation ATPase
MDPKTTEILEINKDIAHWQSDLENLMDFKNQLVHNWQRLGFSQEKYYNEMRDVEEQIKQTKENISYFIKKKVDLQRELDIFKPSSVLGKRSGE